MANPNPSDSLPKLEELLTRLSIQQLSLGDKIDNLIHHIVPLVHPTPSTPSANPVVPQPHTSSPAQIHKLKLDVPRFDSSNPNGWLFKINQFFDYHDTPPSDRLTITSFYMEGRALAWFQWMQSNGQLTSWSIFTQALQRCFAQSPYDDPTGTLFKLTQQGSVSAYLVEFEDLANCVEGLPQAFLLTCFVAGLSPEIHREVQIHQPLTLAQAVDLARIQEEKVLDQRHASRPGPTLSSPSFTHAPSNPPPPTPPLLAAPTRFPPPAVKWLSLEEIASRRERGLCFTCDKKYHRGHRCASRVFLFVTEEDDPPQLLIEPGDQLPEPPDLSDPSSTQISLNSLEGLVAPKTLHLVGMISGHKVVLLVNSGSTHNFIQEQLVEQLDLLCHHTTPLKVMVGNGQHLECCRVCPNVSIEVQTTTFMADLHVLPISGANMVLEV